MINANDLPRISYLFSSIFFYGFEHGYSENTIEEKILDNKFFNSLENGDTDFLNNYDFVYILKSIYGQYLDDKHLDQTNPLSLWLGDIYTKIFFSVHKSLSFIFLYLPLKKAVEQYHLYHEMDISQLVDYFNNLVKSKTVLSLLLKKRNITAVELSSLTGINYNTIINLTRSNDALYKAQFDSIYKISQVLKVNINIFASSINTYTNSSMFDFDKQNKEFRSYLGHYIACYYQSDLDKRNYQYDFNNNIFVSGDRYLKVESTSSSSNPQESFEVNKEIEEAIDRMYKTIAKNNPSKYVLVIFQENQISQSLDSFKKIDTKEFEKIIIINAHRVFCIGDTCRENVIDDNANNIMINNAKRAIGGDFAI